MLVTFAALALFGAWLARKPRSPRFARIARAPLGTSSQVAVRLCVLVVIGMFFVMSGVVLDVQSIIADPAVLVTGPGFAVLFLVVRGLPAFLAHRHALGGRDALALGFMSASALPLLVVDTTVGVSSGILPEAHAAALVMAGIVSVLVYPMVAERLRTGVQLPGTVQHTEEYKPDAL